MGTKLAFIIEDDPDLQVILTRALLDAGFEAESATDGQTAKRRLANVTPQVIILDLHLPDVLGAELLSYIQQLDHLSQSKVIIVTADALNAERLRSQVAMVILKPTTYSQLRDLMKRLL